MNFLATIIVNYNSEQLIQNRLEELNYIQTDIFIANNSNSDLVKLIDFNKSKNKIFFINNASNLGFGTAINHIIKKFNILSNYSFIQLLNPDCNLKTSYLQSIIIFLKNTNEKIILAPLLKDIEGNKYYGSFTRFPFIKSSHIKKKNFNYNKKFSWPTASCLFIKSPNGSHNIEFDEQFFMYWEDADLIQDLLKKQYSIINYYINDDEFFYHEPGRSSDININSRYVWHLQSQLIFIKKHCTKNFILKYIIFLKYFIKSLVDLDVSRMKIILNTFKELR